ncbi:MAG: cadherin repeat domain-containing protein, partial [Gammaproteobacteria bacterium]|nr:cadherin repeat domain-containing protein [Gammaproteobacteria bacterium]
MPFTAFRGERDERVVRKRHPLNTLYGGLIFQSACLLWLAFVATNAHAIPPNTPVTNTTRVAYQVAGIDYLVSDSHTFTSDPGAGNSAPYDILLAPSLVPENADGALVGQLTALDLDPTDTHVFTISDPRFVVVGDQLSLAVGETLDFETEPTVTLDVTATDPSLASVTLTLVINVVNINEAPTDLVLSSTTLVANVLGAPVGDLTVVDPDVGDVHVFTVADVRFEIVAGLLKLIDSEGLPLGASVNVLITTTDAGGLSYAESFTITATPPGGGAANSNVIFSQYALLP